MKRSQELLPSLVTPRSAWLMLNLPKGTVNWLYWNGPSWIQEVSLGSWDWDWDWDLIMVWRITRELESNWLALSTALCSYSLSKETEKQRHGNRTKAGNGKSACGPSQQPFGSPCVPKAGLVSVLLIDFVGHLCTKHYLQGKKSPVFNFFRWKLPFFFLTWRCEVIPSITQKADFEDKLHLKQSN